MAKCGLIVSPGGLPLSAPTPLDIEGWINKLMACLGVPESLSATRHELNCLWIVMITKEQLNVAARRTGPRHDLLSLKPLGDQFPQSS